MGNGIIVVLILVHAASATEKFGEICLSKILAIGAPPGVFTDIIMLIINFLLMVIIVILAFRLVQLIKAEKSLTIQQI
ncbi:unnamed protein product [Rotaria sordida]|uniref:Uncharacterized protein n=2 Tax=Rotaria sordida TaxID=392033 RepID=A0A815U406_9BILA|nr:unnamed protein product [Rotaria sordida]